MRDKRILLSLLAAGLLTGGARGNPVRDRHVEAELVAAAPAVAPGTDLRLGVVLRHDQGWHTYWKNNGDSGLPTEIEWTLPEGVEVTDIEWPFPRRYQNGPFVDFGFEGEAVLLMNLRVPEGYAQETVPLKAQVDWLMCEDVCIPGGVTLETSLPVATSPSPPSPPVRDLFARAEAALPRDQAEGWTFRLEPGPGGATRLHAIRDGTGPDLDELEFFPDRHNLLASYDVQPMDETVQSLDGEDRPAWTLRLTPGNEPDERLTGVLVARPGFDTDGALRAVLLDLPWPDGERPAATPGDPVPVADAAPTWWMRLGLPGVLIAAFLGGLILNATPCVFPVLSIRVTSLVTTTRDASKGEALRLALAFVAGVLVSLWILAGVLLALRAAGEAVGWGFHMQDPRFVVAMAVLFFVMGLSLVGVFEVGTSLTALGGKSTGTGLKGSFGSGLLTTLVATPCTAPLMAPAIGFALQHSTGAALAIFTALALGLALPFALLTSQPQLLQKLPPPGPWMETLKQAMGLLLMAVVLWMVWVFMNQGQGPLALFALLVGFLLLAIGAWIYGHWGAIHRPAVTRRVSLGLFVLLIAGSVGFPLRLADAGMGEGAAADAEDEFWAPWTPEAQAESLASGRPVFIDFTAEWCMSCKVNEATTLNRDRVRQGFRDREVIMLKADWTNRNPDITAELERFGQSGVPLYLLYPPGETVPRKLPHVLTPGIVLSALEDLPLPG